MTNKVSGRVAFILAVGLLAGLAAAPSWAADPQTDAAGVTAPAADPQSVWPSPTAPGQTASGDQLNASDRAAQPDDMKTPVVVTQSPQPDAAAAHPSPVVAGSQSASWDETSLIGKIFIGFGALLTVASAARMFIA